MVNQYSCKLHKSTGGLQHTESDDFTDHYMYIIRLLSAHELVLPPLQQMSAVYMPYAHIQVI